ncbi:hypothetical protein [Prosthecobacter sp.]|uniref:hypothetical protein n=1 Tax=Prosthecobacter sp. TaxID=1965333 RepID=UPI003783610E
MAEDTSIVANIARDMNRQVLGGGRCLNDQTKKMEPAGLLTGQQAPVNPADMKTYDVRYRKNGTDIPGGLLSGHRSTVDRAYTAAKTALTGDMGVYFDLQEDFSVPTWLLTPKQFTISTALAPEEFVNIDNTHRVARLPAPALIEAASKSPKVSYCKVIKLEEDNATSLALETIPKADWKSAILLRCPVRLAPSPPEKTSRTRRGKTNRAAARAPVVYELKGIPQGDRWYLDQLHLLPGPTETAVPLAGATLMLFVEFTNANKERQRTLVSEWTMARDNLSGLARPGSTFQLNLQHLKSNSLPYTAESDSAGTDPSDALRLLQMASITNNGGYYFRVITSDVDLSAVAGEDIVLCVVLLLPDNRRLRSADESRSLPVYANAIEFSTAPTGDPADTQNRILRFDEKEHFNITPTSPPGCLTFGWTRHLPWPMDPKLDVRDPNGFAESIHLVDYEVADSNGKLITSWSPIPDSYDIDPDKNWKSCVCAADSITPLSPTKDIGIAAPLFDYRDLQDKRVAARYLPTSTDQTKRAARATAGEHTFKYRTTVRFAYKDVFKRMAVEADAEFALTAGFRDLYGNRLFAGSAKANRTLIYTDALIKPQDWPGFHFAASAKGGQLCLKVWFERPDPLKFHLGQVKMEEMTKSFGAARTRDIDTYVNRRLLTSSGFSISKLPDQPTLEQQHRFVLGLRAIVDGPNIYDPKVFKHVNLRDETAALILTNPKGEQRRLLNRLLLEDSFPHTLAPYQPRNVKTDHQLLQRLALILDQLTGTADDVTVSLWDAGRRPLAQLNPNAPNEADRANFDYQHPSIDLRKALREYLAKILATGGIPPTQPVECYWDVQKRSDRPGPVRLYPVLQIARDTTHLPVNELPSDGDLSIQILRQIRLAESAMPLASGDEGTSAPHVEFKAVALAFRAQLQVGPSCQVGMTRNRFNEHELWFIPNTSFPTLAPADPIYATPRPLKNQLGSETFVLPDFTKYVGTSASNQWNGFPLPEIPTSFAGLDYDVLGRRIFAAFEGMLTPLAVTEPNDTNMTPWFAPLLPAKDLVAMQLADPDNCILPLFAELVPSANASGISRMAQDAFQGSLKNFYDIDTLIGLPLIAPVDAPQLAGRIRNYYGRTIATFPPKPFPAAKPSVTSPVSVPSFSDFVISLDEDFSPNSDPAGYLTLAYHLPPGEEANWVSWKPTSLATTITHVQLPVPNQPALHAFDAGQWLELAFPNASLDPNVTQQWNLKQSIPAIDRVFPPEPALKAVTPIKCINFVTDINGNPLTQTSEETRHASRWGWEIDFAGNYDNNDRVYLEIDYYTEEATKRVVAKHLATWRPQSLLQVLVALDSLLAAYPTWTSTAINDLPRWRSMIESLASLLDSFVTFVNQVRSKATAAPPTPNNYWLDISTATPTGTLLPPFGTPGLLVDQLRFAITSQGTQPETREYSITANVDKANEPHNHLLLFGSTLNALGFQPRLSLKRNVSIPDTLGLKFTTDPRLVYESGPVVWPKIVPVTNSWPILSVNDAKGRKLTDIILQTLQGIFGIGSNLDAFTLRISIRHAFNLLPSDPTGLIVEDPICLFPVDYGYSSVELLAEAIAHEYVVYLTKQGGTINENLDKIVSPRLRFGIQAAQGNAEAKPPTPVSHVLLEIEAIEIPTDQLNWSA